ncbi:sensor histidine kinase [Romboutsia ilealis]|uniref:sensor histidine kinase n=1 Tax=Romboutsia ilealis TaxID=1115758 RepID=UPI00272B8745|nr:HAMP domain-containing sensor histidine kinase [Romboutsia ilealis]
MYNIKSVKQGSAKIQNNLFTWIIILLTLIIGILYIERLFNILKIEELKNLNVMDFIQLFNSILAALAIGSSLVCYISSKKEELFIISLMYIIFFIDIIFGNLDNINLQSQTKYMDGYITIGTSLIRIIILLISILPCKKIKDIIISNKGISILIVTIMSIFIGTLESKYLNFRNKENYIILYNIFLIIVYLVVAITYLVKSIRQKEYIYSVISSSIFLFGVKAFYATVATRIPILAIRLTCISITYMGFIIFIGGLFLELILNIKRNKELENELSVFYHLVDENKYSCVVIYNENGKVEFANKTVKKFIFENPCVKNEKVESVIVNIIKELDENIILEIKDFTRKYKAWDGNIYIPSLDMTLECNIQNTYTKFGENKYTLIFKDISSRVRTEKYLIEYEKMKKHEEVKNEFFANISHELRTPLNIFYSTLQLLDLKNNDMSICFREVYGNHKQCLEINCKRMLRLINNIVDITKIDVGFTQAKFVNCDIVRAIEDITLSVINYAENKNINIVFDTEIEEHIIKCDLSMIERAMLNLLSNAIKFTKENGNIAVNLYKDEQWVHILVKDDGIGIPIDIQDMIFERFVQVDKSLTRLNEGSGIGLSIVKSIVELNKGEIYLDSDGENGTEFEILLPNEKLEDYEYDNNYKVNLDKIELEFSDIYELYN